MPLLQPVSLLNSVKTYDASFFGEVASIVILMMMTARTDQYTSLYHQKYDYIGMKEDLHAKSFHLFRILFPYRLDKVVKVKIAMNIK